MAGSQNAPLFARRVTASPCAGLLVHWMKERYGDLVFLHVAHEGAHGELSWCPANQFHGFSDHIHCGEIGGCKVYVALGDLDLMRPGHLAVDVIFEGRDEEAMQPRLVTQIRPFTADEEAQQAFAQECQSGEANEDLLWDSEQLTLALFGRLSASARR